MSRRVIELDAADLVTCFGQLYDRARNHADPEDAYTEVLGGYVYGFSSIGKAVVEDKLPNPSSIAVLKRQLDKHLYVERGPILINDHTLRVATDDDEVELAYFFLDAHAAAQRERTAFLLLTEPSLPDGAAEGTFTPPHPIAALTFEGTPPAGDGCVYACLLTSYDGESMPGKVRRFPGTRLPTLARTLREVVPGTRPQSWGAEWLDTWPIELRVLRALVEAGDTSIGPALERANTVPIDGLVHHAKGVTNYTHVAIGEHRIAKRAIVSATEGLVHDGDPAKSIVHVGEHVALACMHTSSSFGFQQWILFDDLWAAAHPDLASSILRYGNNWDPFFIARAKPDPVKKAQRAWSAAIADRTSQPYATTIKFALGDVMDHPKFGLGAVAKVDGTTIEVRFAEGVKKLTHAR
jgi:hypothetical protein